MENQLKNETSPYLLQHAENPVNWYPWCEDAFQKAKAENKPVFLSIGYSTCHWCHVMAHESFEDNKTADILNKYFISIKVDREERPDIDSVYMSVCQAFTGSGGWPMSIFMTWDKKPFFAGTYFPPRPRYGMPGFSELLNTIANRWKSHHADLLESAEEIIEHLKNTENPEISPVAGDLIQRTVGIFENTFDSAYGGFGNAPKFPTPHNLLFLMLYAKQNDNYDILKMAEKTLLQMRKGGIFDQVGYGFSRYSTDRYYLAPHFEKMLYDNALLIIAYASAYNITNNNIYLDTAEKTAQYVLREMTSEYGGFYSAQDADSEGVEGKYYTFSLKEIIEILGEERGNEFANVFDITHNGNFEGANIPNLLKSSDLKTEFQEEIKKLYSYRKNRFKLHLDDKILLSWNSMMIAALTMLYRVTRNDKYLNAAQKSQEFIEKNLSDGRSLYTSFRDGKCSKNTFLDDYAFYVAALIELYNSTLEKSYLEKAEKFCKETVRLFMDDKNGGFYLSSLNSTELFLNPKETYDGAIPSGNSVMAYNLVRLYQITEVDEYKTLLEKQLNFMSAKADEYATGNSMFLIVLMLYEDSIPHITVALKDYSELNKIKEKLPFLANVSVVTENKKYPLLNNQTTFYVCKNHNCLPPTNEVVFL
ncbi:MAG: thioredoxin domain-containing protein [Ruminococcaceae bacterium]|nr:thioredoxin domain-containing protein [Oscillospiraceae bacterium]